MTELAVMAAARRCGVTLRRDDVAFVLNVAARTMTTARWSLKGSAASPAELLLHSGLQEAAALLAAGEVVAFPTETVYGLGCDCTNAAAIEKVYAAKASTTSS